MSVVRDLQGLEEKSAPLFSAVGHVASMAISRPPSSRPLLGVLVLFPICPPVLLPAAPSAPVAWSAPPAIIQVVGSNAAGQVEAATIASPRLTLVSSAFSLSSTLIDPAESGCSGQILLASAVSGVARVRNQMRHGNARRTGSGTRPPAETRDANEHGPILQRSLPTPSPMLPAPLE